jgi:serine/threonine protein kinase
MGDMQGADLAGYRILEEIGGQAGSRIYKALAPDGKQIVAIKLFPPQIASDHKLLQELRDSLRTVAHMHHPGTPPILGSGLFNGRPYIVTPFLKAGSLSDRIWRGMLSALNVDQLIVDIADALEYAHAHGVVHGDMKPADVLFDEDGKVFINNFGQASVLRKLHDDSDQSPEGGKEYRAPEIGAGASLSPSSDQYSLGLMALELLTGQSAAKALQSIRDHRREGLGYRAGSRWISSDLPEPVIDVLLRAVDEHPERRFTSVEEMRLAFQAAIGVAPTPTVTPKPPIERTKPRRQPRKIIPVLATTIAIGLLVIVTLPALSSTLKRIEDGVTNNEQMAETVPREDIAQSAAISEASEGNAELPSSVENEASLNNSPENTQLTTISEGEEPASGGETSPVTTTEKMPLVEPEASTPTSPPTNPPTSTPTINPVSTDTPPPPPTPVPSPTPTDLPLEKKCSDKPSHPHYCTPTPES